MANFHYFHVKHITTGQDHVVHAPRASAAVGVVAGERAGVKPASNDEIADHFAAGLSLHEKSLAEGEGRLFLAKGEPDVLIRAKNAGTAFEAIGAGSYKVEKCSQDLLVNLLTSGIVPKKFEDKARSAAGTLPGVGDAQGQDAANDASADGDDTGAAGEGEGFAEAASADTAAAAVAEAQSGASDETGEGTSTAAEESSDGASDEQTAVAA